MVISTSNVGIDERTGAGQQWTVPGGVQPLGGGDSEPTISSTVYVAATGPGWMSLDAGTWISVNETVDPVVTSVIVLPEPTEVDGRLSYIGVTFG